MPKFNVGDVLCYPDGAHGGINYKVTEITEGYYKLERVGYTGSHRVNMIDSMLILETPANPNLITVSSLDYMSSTTLTDEDKLIIMEHLEHA